ncbi:MAG: hypothetical protein NVS9B10_24640 [Nevskia sp.]
MNRKNPSRITRLALPGIALGLAAMLSPAQAADATTTRLEGLHQAEDGSLVALRPSARAQEPVRYVADCSQVSSRCLVLKTEPRRFAGSRSRLVNTCSYAVSVSYCLDSANAEAPLCSAVGARKAEAARIEAGAALVLEGAVLPEVGINWLACRGEPDVVSMLTDGGSRGECLVERGASRLAAADEAAPPAR